MNTLYFATHRVKRPRGREDPLTIGHHWRCALVLFFNYGLDTGTLWKTMDDHEPIRWGMSSGIALLPPGSTKNDPAGVGDSTNV